MYVTAVGYCYFYHTSRLQYEFTFLYCQSWNRQNKKKRKPLHPSEILTLFGTKPRGQGHSVKLQKTQNDGKLLIEYYFNSKKYEREAQYNSRFRRHQNNIHTLLFKTLLFVLKQ